jgi:hypothetical protein
MSVGFQKANYLECADRAKRRRRFGSWISETALPERSKAVSTLCLATALQGKARTICLRDDGSGLGSL